MEVTQNVQAQGEIISSLQWLGRSRSGVHVSDLVLCLRKSYLRAVHEILPTEEEVLFWLVGRGYHAALEGYEQPSEVSLVRDGLMGTPDQVILENGRVIPVEIKSTRQSVNKDILENIWWLRTIKAYCFLCSTTFGRLVVLNIIGDWKDIAPQLRVFDFGFTPEEIQENWEWLQARKALYLESFEKRTLPPLEKTPAWMCKSCVVVKYCGESGK